MLRFGNLCTRLDVNNDCTSVTMAHACDISRSRARLGQHIYILYIAYTNFTPAITSWDHEFTECCVSLGESHDG